MNDDLLSFAEESGAGKALGALVFDLSAVIADTARLLKGAGGSYAGTQNVYGEDQLKADVAANSLFMTMLKGHSAVASIASEELEGEESGKGADGSHQAKDQANDHAKDVVSDEIFSVAFDPLDGSSLVESNLAVGSIVGIWPGRGFTGRKGSEQVAAILAVYGPRLTMVITFGKGVAEFLYDNEEGGFKRVGQVKLDTGKKIFAPGNLRACATEEWYTRALEWWAKNGYTLRYSGGMVPDVNQILKKGGGVFSYPGYKEKPEGKLRLLYECAPAAMIVENAGGKADSGTGAILDIVVEKLDQRTPIFLGSKDEVERALSFMP